MSVRSKWQSLPTEAINPATLAIDKLSARRHRRGHAERRPQDARRAVHREKERIAVGVDIITQALRKGGRIIFVGAGTSGRLGVARIGRDAADLRHRRQDLVQAIMAGGKEAVLQAKRGRRGQLRGRRAIDQPAAAAKKDVVDRRVGQRHDAVRARRADARAPRRRRRSSSSPAIRAPSCRPSST